MGQKEITTYEGCENGSSGRRREAEAIETSSADRKLWLEQKLEVMQQRDEEREERINGKLNAILAQLMGDVRARPVRQLHSST